MIELTKIDIGAICVRRSETQRSAGMGVYHLLLGRYEHMENFEKMRLDAYAAAIDEYKRNGGAAHFLLAEIAPFNIGRSVHNLEGYRSLWVNENCGDLSDFWQILKQKKELQNAILRIKSKPPIGD